MYRSCFLLAIFMALLFACPDGRLSANLPAQPDPTWKDDAVPDQPAQDDENGGVENEGENDKTPAEGTSPKSHKNDGCGMFSMVDCVVVFAALGACVHLNRNLRKSRKDHEAIDE